MSICWTGVLVQYRREDPAGGGQLKGSLLPISWATCSYREDSVHQEFNVRFTAMEPLSRADRYRTSIACGLQLAAKDSVRASAALRQESVGKREGGGGNDGGLYQPVLPEVLVPPPLTSQQSILVSSSHPTLFLVAATQDDSPYSSNWLSSTLRFMFGALRIQTQSLCLLQVTLAWAGRTEIGFHE